MLKQYKISNEEKKKIIGGSKTSSSSNFWNNSIGFGIIGSTILSIIQFIYSIVNSFISKDDNSNKTSNFSPTYSKKNVSYRLSKYPSKTTAFIS